MITINLILNEARKNYLNVANPCLIPGISCGNPSAAGMTFEHRAHSKLSEHPGVSQSKVYVKCTLLLIQ